MVENKSFQDATLTLLREAFEGKPQGQNFTWFVQGREGIFDALDNIDADVASVQPDEECASIGAHAYHLLYIMCGANMCHGGPAPKGTWESTWEKNEFSDAEWDGLRRRLHEEYEMYLEWFAKNTDWTEENAYVAALTPLPHVAYHLGAIRQILQLV